MVGLGQIRQKNRVYLSMSHILTSHAHKKTSIINTCINLPDGLGNIHRHDYRFWSALLGSFMSHIVQVQDECLLYL